MKTAICVVIVAAVLAAPVLAQIPTAARPAKHTGTTGELKYESRIEGETIDECWPIASLPFTGTGNTCAFLHDYDEACPYYGSTSPDVVYCYSPPYDMCVSISLCDSYYDTKVYVYEDAVTPGSLVGCNDDSPHCVDPPVDYTSWLESVPMFASHTYYIVVDGYVNNCGDYVLAVDEIDCPEPCDIICVGIPEGEPTCYDGYDDQYNGGCSTFSFSSIPADPDPNTFCGESGVFEFEGSTYRDTDWYLIYPCGGVAITAIIEAEVPVLFGFVDLREGCENMGFYSYDFAADCAIVSITEYLPEGQFAVFVAPADWLPEYECGSEYSLTIDGYTQHCDPTPAEVTSWGRVKSLYR